MLEKVKAFFAEKKAKAACAVTAALATLSSAVPAFAAEPATSNDVISGVQQLWSTLSGTLNVTNIVQIIAIVLGAAVVLVLFWFGARYVTRKITKAAFKGRMNP